MQERESRNLHTEIQPDVDHLLAHLRSFTQHDPPAAIRERLARLSQLRLGIAREMSFGHQVNRRRVPRAIPIAACAFAVMIACAFVAGVVVHRRAHLRAIYRAAVSSPAIPEPARPAKSAPMVSSAATPSDHRQSRPRRASTSQLSRLVIPLPYSDSAVAMGTEVTVPVYLSQDELISLGVPISPAVHDRQFVADLLLGDDGLPRAISVPLPPGVLAEKR